MKECCERWAAFENATKSGIEFCAVCGNNLPTENTQIVTSNGYYLWRENEESDYCVVEVYGFGKGPITMKRPTEIGFSALFGQFGPRLLVEKVKS